MRVPTILKTEHSYKPPVFRMRQNRALKPEQTGAHSWIISKPIKKRKLIDGYCCGGNNFPNIANYRLITNLMCGDGQIGELLE